MRIRPLLLLDVDGVISIFGFDTTRRPPGDFIAVDGIIHFIAAGAAAQLARLATAFELAWCTGWEEKANERLVPLLGLAGPLPTLSFEAVAGGPGRHWKLAAIEAHVGPRRPVAWIDDDHDHATVEAWRADRPGPTLLVRTQPATGITDAHVEQLLDWTATGFGHRACR